MSENILIKYTKAAVVLCNDYRDTLFYAGLAVFEIGNVVMGRNLSSSEVLMAPTLREFVRSVSWVMSESRLDLGTIEPGTIVRSPPNAERCYISALSAGSIIGGVWGAALAVESHHATHFVLSHGDTVVGGLIAGAVAYKWAGGIKGLAKCYRDTMWDHPRKNKPPGGPNPLTETFGKLSTTMLRILRIQKSMAAVPAGAKSSRALQYKM